MIKEPSHSNGCVPELPPTRLWAILLFTLLLSVCTGMLWSGLPFIARDAYGYLENEVLVLFFAIGLTYVIAAMSASPLLFLLRRWLSPRAFLSCLLVAQALVCLTPLWITSPAVVWLVALPTSVLNAWLWPVVESYVAAGRHGNQMRRAMGWWNITWTTATMLSLFFMGPIMEAFREAWGQLGNAAPIVLFGPLSIIGLIPLAFFRKMPGAHDTQEAQASVGRDYQSLLVVSRVLLPLSYVLMAALSPLLPFLLDRLQLDVSWETALVGLCLGGRVAAMVFMWRIPIWHGHWWPLFLAALAMSGGFTVVVLIPTLMASILGLTIFGIGMGMVYFSALYYAMSVGHAQVDAGGTHEALIGSGYTIGPLAVLGGLALGSAAEQAGWPIAKDGGIVVVTLAIVAAGYMGAWWLYQRNKSSHANQ